MEVQEPIKIGKSENIEEDKKRAEFEAKEIFGAPLPLEFGNLNFYGILAEDICPEKNIIQHPNKY